MERKTPSQPPQGKTRPQPEPEREAARKPDNEGPLDVEGGRRSDVNGKFEADHRPSR